MKTLHVVLLAAFLGWIGSAHAIDKIRVTDAVKTVDKRQSSSQAIPHGSTSLTERQVQYTFGFQRMASDVPESLTASWVLIREGMDGRLAEASRGTACVALPLGRVTTLETEPVGLTERDWNHRGKSGETSSSVAGYGLRLTDADGNIVLERYEPKSIQPEVKWDKPPHDSNERIQDLKQQIKAERRRENAADRPPRPKR